MLIDPDKIGITMAKIFVIELTLLAIVIILLVIL